MAGCDRLHFGEQGVELCRVEFAVKVEAEEVIGEGDFRAHLQLLGERVRGLGLVLAQGVVEQSAQSFGAELHDLAQALELIASGGVFFRIG